MPAPYGERGEKGDSGIPGKNNYTFQFNLNTHISFRYIKYRYLFKPNFNAYT